MDRIQARANRDARQESVLARLISKVKRIDDWGDLNEPVEHSFRYLQDGSDMILKGFWMPTQVPDSLAREYEFSQNSPQSPR